MRARTLLLAACLLSLPAIPAVQAHHRAGPCDLHQGVEESIRRFSIRQIRCAVTEFGPLPGGADRAICIADRESNLQPDAESPTGLYQGLYQHAAEYWDWRYDTYTKQRWSLPASALKGRTNAIVTIRMVAGAGGWTAAGWRRGDC